MGERFELEIRYDDLRLSGSELGAFQVLADVSSTFPEALHPLLTETQLFTVDASLQSQVGDLKLSMEDRGTTTISYLDFTSDPIDSMGQGLLDLGFGADQFSVTERRAADPNQLQLRIRFLGEDFYDQDVPELVGEFLGTTISVNTTEIGVKLSDGSPNPAAVPFNVIVANPTFNNGEDFYSSLTSGSLDSTNFLTRIGGLGQLPKNGVGIPDLTNDGFFIQPFFVVALPFEVAEAAVNVEYAVSPNVL